MKKSLIAAVVFASASFGSSAVMAQVIGNTPQALSLTDGSGYFGDVFGADNGGATFSDRFTFTVTGTTGSSLNAIVGSSSSAPDVGLDITGFSVYRAAGDTLVSTGSVWHSGATDVWTVYSDNLTAGSYYLRVNGNVVSDDSAAFGGAVSLAAAVPEPETYGMMLGGLGLLGWLARRRKGGRQA
jgi:hypothetical protein